MENIRYITSNNINMVKCSPLNWRIAETYEIVPENEINPEFYCISVGNRLDMCLIILIPETMLLTFNINFTNEILYRFKVSNIEEASKIVLKFAEGMNAIEYLKDTIYWNDDTANYLNTQM